MLLGPTTDFPPSGLELVGGLPSDRDHRAPPHTRPSDCSCLLVIITIVRPG